MKDHRTEAKMWLVGLEEFVSEEGQTDATLIASPLISQAHATIYLAEQQRVANLIAYYALVVHQEVNGIVPTQYTNQRLDIASNQIIEGLGL